MTSAELAEVEQEVGLGPKSLYLRGRRQYSETHRPV
jgi:hypothetical protein